MLAPRGSQGEKAPGFECPSLTELQNCLQASVGTVLSVHLSGAQHGGRGGLVRATEGRLSVPPVLRWGLKEPTGFGSPQRLWILISLGPEATTEVGL